MDSFGAAQPKDTQSSWSQDLDTVQTKIEGGQSLAQVSDLLTQALEASTASRSYCLQMPFMDNVIEALSIDQDPDNTRTALLVCLKISKSYKIEHNNALDERGVIDRVARLLGSYASMLEGDTDEKDTTLSYIELSLLLLQDLVEGSKARSDKLLSYSIVEPVRYILRRCLGESVSTTTACLSLFSEIMSKSGPIKSIADVAIELLLTSSDPDILSTTLILLLEFQQTPGSSLYLASSDGVVSGVIERLDFYQPFGVLAPALRILETWATHSPAVLEVFIHQGLLESLIALTVHYSSLVAECSFSVLRKLCKLDSNVKHCFKRGIINDTLKYVAKTNENTPEKREACALVIECLMNGQTLASSYFRRILMAPYFMPAFVEIMEQSTGIQASQANGILFKVIELGTKFGPSIDDLTPDTEPQNPYLDFLYARLGSKIETMDELGDDINTPLRTAHRQFQEIGRVMPQ